MANATILNKLKNNSTQLNTQDSNTNKECEIKLYHRGDADKSEVLEFVELNCNKIEIGKYVSFGNYYQENENSKDPIEWLVLDIDTENKKALLISRYALDSKPLLYVMMFQTLQMY
jgi:hypothetical protein